MSDKNWFINWSIPLLACSKSQAYLFFSQESSLSFFHKMGEIKAGVAGADEVFKFEFEREGQHFIEIPPNDHASRFRPPRVV